LSLADFQILAAILVVSIPRPSVSLMLKVSKVFVHASRIFYSSKDGFLEFHEVFAIAVPSLGLAVRVLGLVIVPSRYHKWSLTIVKLNNYCTVYYCSLIYEPCLHKHMCFYVSTATLQKLSASLEISLFLSGCLLIFVG